VSIRISSYLRAVVQPLRSSDLEALLTLLADVRSTETSRPFTTELMDRLVELVPCEYVTFQETDLATGVVAAYAGCSADEDESFDEPREISDEEFAVHHACTSLVHRRTYDIPDAIVAWSELFDRDRRVNGDVEPWSRELGVVDHASVPLEPSVVRKVWIGFWSCDRDFDERDRRIMELLQPHLAALHRDAALRRTLQAALAALDRAGGDSCGVLLLGPTGEIEFATPGALRLLGDYLGAVPERLPEALGDTPVLRDGRRLVADALGAAVLLREEPVIPAPLTARERDVMRCVAAGKTNAEIAQLLWITPGTVRKHLENVYGKLGVNSRTAALARLPAQLA
jgi:DNA-binding CsgD family transcriptional regulator